MKKFEFYTAEDLMNMTFGPEIHPSWIYDEKLNTLTLKDYHYDIDLCKIKTKKDLLQWIYQIEGKVDHDKQDNTFNDKVLADLIRAFDLYKNEIIWKDGA